jgi:hypothetical protein
MGLRVKNLIFDDIFTGSHHFFLKVHGHDWILGGGLNNYNQLGEVFSSVNRDVVTVVFSRPRIG